MTEPITTAPPTVTTSTPTSVTIPAAPTAPTTPAYTPPATQADLDKLIGTRLNQERAKLGGITPEQLTELRELADKGRQAALDNGTDMQRAVAEAQAAAAKAADDKYLPMLARTSIEGIAAGRVSNDALAKALEYTDLGKFIANGTVDVARVTEFVNSIAPAVTTPVTSPRGPLLPAHNPGGPRPEIPGSAGRAAAERRGYIKTA